MIGCFYHSCCLKTDQSTQNLCNIAALTGQAKFDWFWVKYWNAIPNIISDKISVKTYCRNIVVHRAKC